MLLRCDVTEKIGLIDLHQCALLGQLFQARGHQIAYAINRQGIEPARAFLGREAQIYRIPDDPDEGAARLGHLARTHKHKVAFIALRDATSSFLFQVHRLFDYTAVIDQGSQHLIYARLVINGRLNAHSHPYNCCAEARLLLGPKFHICDPTPVADPHIPARPDEVLLNLGTDPSILRPVVEALVGIRPGPEVHILVPLGSDTEALDVMLGEMGDVPVKTVPAGTTAFPYHSYPMIITQSGDLCLELAHQGLSFMTLATDKAFLQEAYVLDQMGAAPTLGWHGSKKAEVMRAEIEQFWADKTVREKFSRTGRQLIDGQGIMRIARFIPVE